MSITKKNHFLFKGESKMSVSKLKNYVKKHGVAKTSVALGYKDTGAVKNMIARKKISETKKDDVKRLVERVVCVLEKGETIKPADA